MTGGYCHSKRCGNNYNMVKRIINGIELEIDEKEANEIYFPKDFVDTLDDFDGDIDILKESIYRWNGNIQYLPLSILWELTNNCNFNCPFCYINTDLAKRYPYLALDEARNIIDELVEMGMLFCCLSGGECLLHPHFLEIYRYLKQKGVLVTVFTNGSLINTKILNVFREYKPYKVEISIYGLSDSVFRYTTNSAKSWNAEIVLDAIEQLKSMDINVRCKSPITTLNKSDILKIQAWCNKRGIDYYTSEEMLESNEGMSRKQFAVEADMVGGMKISRQIAIHNRVDNKFDCKHAWECSAGKFAGVIGADRNFYPCLAAVGIRRFLYSTESGMSLAVKRHKEVIQRERGVRLDFCEGCNKYSICEKCIITSEKERREDILKQCCSLKMI